MELQELMVLHLEKFKFYIAIKSYKYLIPISQIKNTIHRCMNLDIAASPDYHISIHFLDAVDGSVEITYFDA